MAKSNNPVLTRFTTGKVRLTYTFLWQPHASGNENDEDKKDDKEEKYSTCVLIPKGDQATIEKLNMALNYAVQLGQSKGLWGASLPINFKLPLHDGDAAYLEKGEEYKGHWYLNVSSTRRPRIVDLARNDIYDESEVYSGCYARVCINLFPFSRRGNRGIACGLEAVQKICDGEMLGVAPLNVDEAFGDSNAYMANAVQPANSYQQQGQVYPQPVQQPVQNMPQQAAPAIPVQQGYSQPTQASYPVQQHLTPQQNTGYQTQPPIQGNLNTFASNVAAVGSILPPDLFGGNQQGQGQVA